MAELEFVIPVNKEELLEPHAGQFHVEDVIQPRLLLSSLQDAARGYNSDGTDYIFENFNVYFSILIHGNKLEWNVINKGFDHMERAIKTASNNIEVILQDNEIVNEVRCKYLNIIKMLLYLFTAIMKVKDSKLAAENATKLTLGKKGKKNTEEENQVWTENDKLNALCILYNIIQLPLQRLWDPPLAEENFVVLIAEPCYKMLEEQASIRSKPIRESVIQVLGVLIKRYNHATSCLIRLVQILQMHEHSVSPICAGVVQLSSEFNLVTFGPQMAREIADALVTSGDSEGTEQSSAKNLGTFLVELSKEMPEHMISAIPNLQPHLESDESYSVRISVLGMMCEVLCSVLRGEELTEQQRTVRDDYLDDLQEHIHDVSAHVRSKILQYWCRLQRENCIPVSRQRQVMPLVANRIKDKSALVRKHAINLLKTFLEFNPFSAQLKLDIIEEQLLKERQKLEELQSLVDPQPDSELIKKWEKIEKELLQVVYDKVDQLTQDDPELSQNSLENMYDSIRTSLANRDYMKAFMIIRHAERQYPTAKLLRCDMDKNDQVVYFTALLRNVFIIPDRRNSITVTQQCESDLATYKKIEEQETIVAFLEESSHFCRVISDAVPLINSLLFSKQSGDVAEAIDFFTAAHHFNIDSAKVGVVNMLQLIWSQDQDKREAVMNAYKDLYLTSDSKNDRTKSFDIAKKLVKLIQGIDRGAALAVESLIFKWSEKGDISAAIIQVLWEIFSKKLDGTTDMDSYAALNLLAMISKAKPSVATANIENIQKYGLTSDYKTRELSAQILLALEKKNHIYSMEKDVIDDIYKSVVDCFKRLNKFASFAGITVDLIYAICDTPDLFCGKLLKECYDIMEGMCTRKDDTKEWDCPVEMLSRFVYLLGHIAMRQLIYLDITVYSELRRRNQVREDRKNEEKRVKTAAKSRLTRCEDLRRQTLMMNISNASASARNQRTASVTSKLNATNTSVAEDESTLEGAVADDADAEYVRNVCEQYVVGGDTPLARYIPLLVYILTNKQQQYKGLQPVTTLTLTRYMLVSSVVCEEHLQLLVSVLKCSTSPAVRCNILIGFTDLTLRFPNLTQPWTEHVYEVLQDRNVEVRRCAVKVLSFLILHEMVRVKGQISELARATVDSDHHVRNLSRNFFRQLSQKGNSLYNVMPDIISRLSDPTLKIEEEDFRTIMKFITSLIQKDRQMEALVEKLCQRFKLSTDEKQWRELAYCLSLYNYNERCLRRLIDNFHSYKDKLYCKGVYECFRQLMSSTNKMARNEIKVLVSELNEKIEECFSVGEGDKEPKTPSKCLENDSDQENNAATQNCPPSTVRKSVRKSARSKRVFEFDSDGSDDESSKKKNDHDVFKKPPAGVRRTTRKRK